MLELGPDHEDGHRRTGEAAASHVDRLVVVGDGAEAIAVGAANAGLERERLVSVRDRAEALDVLRTILMPGDVVLVKASRGIELDLLVDDLVAALGGPGAAA